jgi:hypothetical protein
LQFAFDGAFVCPLFISFFGFNLLLEEVNTGIPAGGDLVLFNPFVNFSYNDDPLIFSLMKEGVSLYK